MIFPSKVLVNIYPKKFSSVGERASEAVTTQVIPFVTFTEDFACSEFAGTERRLAVFFQFEINFAPGESYSP